jgi:tetratricopeptide (TPR) repeat protein
VATGLLAPPELLDTASPIARAAPLPQDADAALHIINDSEQTICYVFICPPGAEDVEDCLVATETTIPPGEIRAFDVAAGDYDIALVDCEGNVLLAEEMRVSTITKLHLNTTKVLLTKAVAQYEKEAYTNVIALARQFLDRYPDSDQVPTALLVSGASQAELGEREQATKTPQTLLEAYPNSDEASMAQHLLQQLQSDETPESPAEDCCKCRVINEEGIALRHQGNYRSALRKFQDTLACCRGIQDRQCESAALGNLGNVYLDLGEYEMAISYHEQSLAISRQISDRIREGQALGSLGITHRHLGQYEQAIDYYEQALAIAQATNNRKMEGKVLGNLGSVYELLGPTVIAIDYSERALVIAQEVNDLRIEGFWLGNLGNAYRSLGQNARAIDYYKQGLVVSQETNNRQGEGVHLGNLGLVYCELGKYATGIDYYEQAMVIAQEIGDRESEGRTLGNLGLAYREMGQYQQALMYYGQSIAVRETLRGEIKVEEWKSSFTAEQMYVYDHIIPLLIQMERPDEAFHYVQRAKARTFLDQLGNVRVNSLATDNPRLVEEEETLRGEIQALDAQLREEWAKSQEQRSQEVIRSLQVQLEEKRDTYAKLLIRLKLENPEYASLVAVDTLTLTETQQLLIGATLVEYYVFPEQTLAFVVTSGDFHAESISVTRESLYDEIARFHLETATTLEGVPDSLQRLYDLLIAPIESHLNTRQLLIAPHGLLDRTVHAGPTFQRQRAALYPRKSQAREFWRPAPDPGRPRRQPALWPPGGPGRGRTVRRNPTRRRPGTGAARLGTRAKRGYPTPRHPRRIQRGCADLFPYLAGPGCRGRARRRVGGTRGVQSGPEQHQPGGALGLPDQPGRTERGG